MEEKKKIDEKVKRKENFSYLVDEIKIKNKNKNKRREKEKWMKKLG